MGDAQKLVQNVDRQVEPWPCGPKGPWMKPRKWWAKSRGGGLLASDFKKTLEAVREAIAQVQRTCSGGSQLCRRFGLLLRTDETLAGLNEAARSISLLSEYLKTTPGFGSLGKGNQEVNKMIRPVWSWFRILLLGFVAAAVGCAGSPHSKFYTLSPLATTRKSKPQNPYPAGSWPSEWVRFVFPNISCGRKS